MCKKQKFAQRFDILLQKILEGSLRESVFCLGALRLKILAILQFASSSRTRHPHTQLPRAVPTQHARCCCRKATMSLLAVVVVEGAGSVEGKANSRVTAAGMGQAGDDFLSTNRETTVRMKVFFPRSWNTNVSKKNAAEIQLHVFFSRNVPNTHQTRLAAAVRTL